MTNSLYYGDNLDVLRESIATESVDLVYLDPPFNSQATYNLLFKSPAGTGSQAQIEAFDDTWHWGDEAEGAFDQVMRSRRTDIADMLRALRSFLGENDMMAYLTMMAVRLIELRRVLKQTGSLYLHCDPSASHYLKIILDSIFGTERFINEIVWKRYGAHNDIGQGSKHFGRVQDTILFYSKSRERTWNQLYTPQTPEYIAERFTYKNVDGRRYTDTPLTGPGGAEKGNPVYEWNGHTRAWRVSKSTMQSMHDAGLLHYTRTGYVRGMLFLDETKGVPVQSVWTDIGGLGGTTPERLHYPTQKPVALLERIISASTSPGDVVLDPFCGCGTAIHGAQKLERAWIGIDVTHLAISIIEKRLSAFDGIRYHVFGTPSDLDGARDLAIRDKYQFQWWAVSLIDAQPYGGKRKGADGGIDGLIYFRSEDRKTERAVVSVKGGDNVGVPMIRDLKGVLEREKAPIGIFLTLTPPTRPMEKEASSAGYFTLGDRRYPRIQIITIEDALKGKKPAIPLVDSGAAYKKAPREAGEQQSFL
nr:DNA methyltransferase [uncultured Lichenicoccus sp.]